MSYKESLQTMLDKESVKVLDYLRLNDLQPTEENVRACYNSKNKKVNNNGIKQMAKHLKETANF